MRKKTKKEFNENQVVTLIRSLNDIESRIDKLVRERISNRSSFYFNKFEIDNDDSYYLKLKCVYAEKRWDIETRTIIENKIDYTYFDIDYDPSFDDFEDLIVRAITKLECELYR